MGHGAIRNRLARLMRTVQVRFLPFLLGELAA
jgi:hypothetical protein